MRWMMSLFVLFVCILSYSQDTSRYSIVIHEIYADPTPSHGLPSSEFIELRNRTNREIDLKNWWISNGTSSGKINSNYLLKADSMVIITTNGAVTAYRSYGSTISISPFPSLNNEGDTLILYSPAGTAIHAIAWDKSWYQNDLKEEGGWTLEMKDISKPCSGSPNWIASISSSGGTPGKLNSVRAILNDSTEPHSRYAYMPDSTTLRVVFNQPLTSLPELIPVDVKILSANWLPPLFNLLEIHLSNPPPSISNLEIRKMTGCSGINTAEDHVRFGLFAPVLGSQVIINEILFDPPAGGGDYVELYNRSDQVIDMSRLWMGNRNSSGKISSLAALSNTSSPFYPGEYVLVAEDSNWIHRYYLPHLIRMIKASLPSFPDNEGNVVLTDDGGLVLDELNYSEKWHAPLVSSPEGVALERIQFNRPTNDPVNWHSASGQDRYGTPGYKNSQAIVPTPNSEWISLSNRVISPDLDGRDDLLLINYTLPKPGFLANIKVFDSYGRWIVTIANSEFCGTEGFFRWNGLNNQNQKPPKGSYIIFLQFFHPDGSIQSSRQTIGIW